MCNGSDTGGYKQAMKYRKLTADGQRARTFLKDLIVLNVKMKINRLEQEAMFNLAQGCGAITVGDKVQTSPSNDRMEDAIAELEELKSDFFDLFCQYRVLREQADEVIHKMTEQRYVSVLRLKYFAGMQLESIAEHLNYSTDHVKALHREALNDFGARMDKKDT